MSVADQVNRVKFISEDFASYRQEANEFFHTHYPEEYNNLIATDLGNALMDQLAFAMQALSFTVNRRASELFLSTARLNKSITKLARMLGYSIKPAAPSTCDLTINFTGAPYSFPIVIPIGFQFQGPGDTIYEYHGSVDAIVPPGNTSLTIPVKEGSTKNTTFISDGTENQQFSIFGISSGQYMYSDDLQLTIDGIEWDRISLIGYESSNIFEILFTEDPPKLRFGDGIAGNIPSNNAAIGVTYRSGKGASGAIAQNQIKNAVNPLVINGITIPMKLTNTVAVVGENPEDIRHVRAFASAFFRTQNAAVVKQDYDTIAGLESGVALADAQLLRGVSGDITIQSDFACLNMGLSGIDYDNAQLLASSVSGLSSLGVSGSDQLGVSGSSSLGIQNIASVGVSGNSSLFVAQTSGLGVSGIQFLGVSGSGILTGVGFLGVSGISALFVGGTSSLGVSGTQLLSVSGQGDLGVSGISSLSVSGQADLGWNNLHFYTSEISADLSMMEGCVSGLYSYLSQNLSDTSYSNHVQVVLLGLDSNNRYISPSSTVITNVQAKLDTLKDAVVTINVVDGISKVVPADIIVELGISQTAVIDDVEQKSLAALTSSSEPFGLLVRRSAGKNLYRSDIIDAIRDANQAGDLVFINAKIVGPAARVDVNGNLFITKQDIIQDGVVNVSVKKRLLLNGDLVNA